MYVIWVGHSTSLYTTALTCRAADACERLQPKVAKHRDECSTQPHQPVIRVHKTASQNANSLISQSDGAQQKAARPITLSAAASLAEMLCGCETPYHNRPVNPRTAVRSNAPAYKRCPLGTFAQETTLSVLSRYVRNFLCFFKKTILPRQGWALGAGPRPDAVQESVLGTPCPTIHANRRESLGAPSEAQQLFAAV
jgi:hypothetical protein